MTSIIARLVHKILFNLAVVAYANSTLTAKPIRQLKIGKKWRHELQCRTVIIYIVYNSRLNPFD